MIRQYFLPPTTLLSLHSSDVMEEAVWSYRYSPPSSHASTNSPEILFHHQHSRIIRNIRSTNRARSFRLLVTKQPKTLKGKDTEKFVENIFHGVSSIFPHPRTSTSLPRRRYDISLESSRCQWPGICISPENTRGRRGMGRMVDAPRGVKKREGWRNVPPPLLLFFPSPPRPSTVGEKGLEGEKFRAQLFNRAYRPEWFPWVSGASTNS